MFLCSKGRLCIFAAGLSISTDLKLIHYMFGGLCCHPRALLLDHLHDRQGVLGGVASHMFLQVAGSELARVVHMWFMLNVSHLH